MQGDQSYKLKQSIENKIHNNVSKNNDILLEAILKTLLEINTKLDNINI